jgi:hypothetical protein
LAPIDTVDMEKRPGWMRLPSDHPGIIKLAKHRTMIRWLVLCAQCAIGLFVLRWIMLANHIDGRAFVYRLAQTSFLPLGLSVGCFILAMYLGALRYRLFLPIIVPTNYLIGTTLLQNALLTFVPWRIGEVSYPLLLRRDYQVPLASSSAVIVALRSIDLLIVCSVALVGGQQLGLDLYWAGVALGCAVVAAGLAGAALYKWRGAVPRQLRPLVAALAPLGQPQRLVGFVLLSLAVFATTTLQSALILRAMAFSIAVPDVAILSALSLLAALLPIHPPGGWGTMDSIQVVILERLGYQPNLALPAILAAHTWYTLLIFVGGVIGWLLRGRTRSRPQVDCSDLPS